MKPGDLVIIRHEKDRLTSQYNSLGIVLSAKNLGGTDDLGFQINSSIQVITAEGLIWRMRYELEKI